MAITLFNEDVENVSQLSDLPNSEEGYTSAELKAIFDKAGKDIKTWLNGTHIPELNLAIAKAFTVTFPSGETTYEFESGSYGLNTNSVVICQAQEASNDLWFACNIKCFAVATDKLTFTADTAPSSNVGINVIVMN